MAELPTCQRQNHSTDLQKVHFATPHPKIEFLPGNKSAKMTKMLD